MIRLLWHNIHLTRTSTVPFMFFFTYVLFKATIVHAACGVGERKTWSAGSTTRCCSIGAANSFTYSTDGESGNVRVWVNHMDQSLWYSNSLCDYNGHSGCDGNACADSYYNNNCQFSHTDWTIANTDTRLCLNMQCENNNNDCEVDSWSVTFRTFCAYGCYAHWPGDGYCDSECDNYACNYDNGDCVSPPPPSPPPPRPPPSPSPPPPRPPPHDPDYSSDGSSSPSNAGAIAGGVVGALVFLGLAGCATVCYLKKRQQQQSSQPNTDGTNVESSVQIPVALPDVELTVAETVSTSNDPTNTSNRHPSAMAPYVGEKRMMLEAFYQKHSPAQVAQVDTIMDAYTVEQIQEACMQKYGADPFEPAPPPPPAAAAIVPYVGEKRMMLEAFYQKHSPAQVAQVDAIMDAYTVEQIQEACMQKYGADPFEPAPPPPPASVSLPQI